MRDDNLYQRQTELIEINLTWLRQALALLGEIDDHVFTLSPRNLAPHRVGGHLRHILEFYECFLDGIETSHIDYDARRRDPSIESFRATALDKIRSIIQRLERAPQLRGDSIVWVRVEDAQAVRLDDSF